MKRTRKASRSRASTTVAPQSDERGRHAVTEERSSAVGEGHALVEVDEGSQAANARGVPDVVGRAIAAFESVPCAEPDKLFPYRPDTASDGWRTENFVIRAASVRGYSHRYYGLPRQDEMGIVVEPGGQRVFAAVADGVSASPLSHLGAATAVRSTLGWMVGQGSLPTAEFNWEQMMAHAAWSVVEAHAIAAKSEPDPAAAELQSATTVICAVLEPSTHQSGGTKATVVGAGDSGAWLLDAGSIDPLWSNKSDDRGILNNSVIPLPRRAEVAPLTVDYPDTAVFLLGSDGFGDPIGSGRGEVAEYFAAALATPPPLPEFARILDFSRETFDDDRSLIAVWSWQV